MVNDFESKMKQQVERLTKTKYPKIESEVAKKRISWYKQKYSDVNNNRQVSPRKAYELFFFEYLGITEKEVPVQFETETEIVWLSINKCPTLEACTQLGLDTRSVCRAVYEKSTQAFISQLDPKLRFLRSYQEIRPYAEHCKERIIRIDFEKMMKIAIAEAKISQSSGNKGYGAVVVLGNQIIGKAHDIAITVKDPSLHAEVIAIRQAVRTLDDINLSGALLFSTCEPCPMCSALAVWANLTAIVYGISIKETAQLGKARIQINSNEIISKSPVRIEVVGEVLKDECKKLYL